MARRKARNRSKKLAPTELDLYFSIPANTATSGFIDIAQCLSIINRKFFRQGMQYVIARTELIATDTASAFIYRLPHHWPSVNSWTKTMSMWKKQQDETMDEAGLEDTIAKYRDFKIHMNALHADNGFAANLLPQSASISPGAPGVFLTEAEAQAIDPTAVYEWSPSQVVVPNVIAAGNEQEYYLHMLGPDNGSTSKGMIAAYAQSRSRPQVEEPNIVDAVSGGLFGQMFDVGMDNEAITDNAQEANDQLPYLNADGSTFEFYPGGSESGYAVTQQDMLSVSSTGDRVVGAVGSGFMANCGLLAVGFANNSETQGATFRITLAAGDYKGVMARPMKDVN